MSKRKPVRTRGKLQLSKYFQKFKPGDRVAVVKEPSVRANFSKRLQGQTGIVKERRGKSNVVAIKDRKKPKQHIIKSIHLRKIKTTKK
ncbi:50S ribosomal protein L21e [Candidatus Pacearchaeota archaeon]|nr:50S ribosomal protein L21e [Candidatus Pacearchaeota archaeon]